jgi:hypothetical protein
MSATAGDQLGAADAEAENYNLSLFVDNLFDERAITGRYTECAITTCFGEQYDVVARPMMIGVRFGQSF